MTRNVQKSHAGIPFFTPGISALGIGPDGAKLGGDATECGAGGFELMWIIGAGVGGGGGGGGGGGASACFGGMSSVC